MAKRSPHPTDCDCDRCVEEDVAASEGRGPQPTPIERFCTRVRAELAALRSVDVITFAQERKATRRAIDCPDLAKEYPGASTREIADLLIELK